MSRPQILLFDLGGVIVRWTGIEALMDMKGLSRDQVIERFATVPTLVDYEVGKCDDDSFARAMLDVFELGLTITDFKQVWQDWVGDTYPGAKSALKTLRQDFTLACLSNTNALHWSCLEDRIDIPAYFDHAYASHLIKAAKPASESYQIPMEDMGVSPSNVWFFDDTLLNVEAARNLGIRSFHIDRSVGVIPTLKELGLLE